MSALLDSLLSPAQRSDCMAHDKAAVLAHYTAQAAQIKQSTEVELSWYSKLLGATVTGAIDGEDEPAEYHYHWGSTGGAVWLESVRVGGVEMIEHITEATQAVLLNEALAALARHAE